MSTLERHTLQEWRRLRNMTQLELANAAGLTPTTIHDYESGQYLPKTQSALSIARALAGEDGEPLLLDQILWPAMLAERSTSWRKSTAAAAAAADGGDPKAQAA